MSSAQEHAAAIEALNESEVGGRTIYVSESVPKEKYAANKNKFDGPKKSKCRHMEFASLTRTFQRLIEQPSFAHK
jgi:hypothetical protein